MAMNKSSTLGSAGIAIALAAIVLSVVVATVISSNASRQNAMPISGLLVVLFMMFSPLMGLPALAVLVFLVYYWWVRPVSHLRVHLSSSSWIFLACMVALSAFWYVHYWDIGLQWRGRYHLVGCALMSAALVVLAVVLAFVGTYRRSVVTSVCARWLVLTWVFTYGFAYFGELP